MNRTASWLATALLAATSGCAAAAAQREAQQRLERAVGPYRYTRPEEEVWSAVRRLLAEQGLGLAGADAAAVGQEPFELLSFFSPARETTALRGGGRMLETDWGRGGARYRAEARPGPGGTSVVLTRITEDPSARLHDGPSSRDPALELELIRRLDPNAVADIEARASPGVASPTP
jgi:hypothetical protein